MSTRDTGARSLAQPQSAAVGAHLQTPIARSVHLSGNSCSAEAVDKQPYTQMLLKGGSRLVAWQRFARFRRAARELTMASDGRELETLLDLGAADGIALPFLSPLAKHVVGINYAFASSARFLNANPGKPILTGNGRQLPFRDSSLEAVVCLEMLNVLPGRDAVLQCLDEIRRVLKPDGIFVCSVPIEVGLPAVVKYVGRRYGSIDCRITFRDMLRHCFYRVCDISNYEPDGFRGFNAYRMADDVTERFSVARRTFLPIPYPLCTTLMLVGRPR